MEKIMKKYRDLSFRRAFLLTVLTTFAAVVCLSAAAIQICRAFRNYLLPEPNEVMIKIEYQNGDGSPCSIGQKVILDREPLQIPRLAVIAENGDPASELADLSSIKVSAVRLERSIDMIGPRRRLAYQICGILMILLPGLFSVAGILVSGFLFYRLKMNRPLTLLNQATDEIASENLDFTLEYKSQDELGRLCASFEKMRQVLLENHKALWNMAEERRLLQASVAHDLRNPIAILTGYTEYLKIGLEKETLTRNQLAAAAERLNDTAERLNQYTESVRRLNRIEDMELHLTPINIREFAEKMAADFRILAEDAKICLETVCLLPGGSEASSDTASRNRQAGEIDRDVVYRIAENLMNNALRSAREKIRITFRTEESDLAGNRRFFTIEICDDGPGFPEELLKEKNRSSAYLHRPAGKERSGLGLAIADILCRKHGGRLEISNCREPGHSGAATKIFIAS